MPRSNESVITIRPLTADDIGWRHEFLLESWGSTMVARREELVDADKLPGLVALLDGRPTGLASYTAAAREWELVTIDAVIRGIGIGGALLRAVEALAVAANAGRIWLVTTNDNTAALRFYQRNGYDLTALHRNAVTRARLMRKPQIPLSADGIPIRHELELERILD